MWDCKVYESLMFYHNVVTREKTTYLNPFTHDNKPIMFPELLNDYDSLAEANIFREYLMKYKNIKIDNIKEETLNLSKLLTSKLNERKPSKSKYTLSGLRKDTFMIKRKNKTINT